MTDQIGAGELGQMVDPEIGKEPVSLYDWEKDLEEKGAIEAVALVESDIARRQKDGNLGWLVLGEVVRGVLTGDVPRTAWGMSRMIYLIHREAGKNEHQAERAKEEILLPSAFEGNQADVQYMVGNAARLMGTLGKIGRQSDQDFTFGSGTFGDRMFVTKRDHDFRFLINCTDRGQYFLENLGYYVGLLRLIGVGSDDYESNMDTGQDFVQQGEFGQVRVSFFQGKFTKIDLFLTK